MFYLGILTKDYNLGNSLSDSSEEVREEPGNKGVFLLNKKHVIEHQKITANHREQISQINDFKCFSMYGKLQEPGLTEICILMI